MRFLFSLIFLLFSCLLSAQKITVIEIVQVPSSEFQKAYIYYARNWKPVMDSAVKAGFMQQYSFEKSAKDSADMVYFMMTTVFRDSLQYAGRVGNLQSLSGLFNQDEQFWTTSLKTPEYCRLIFRNLFMSAGEMEIKKQSVENPGHLE